MKETTVVNGKECKIFELSKEQIKAVRILNGLNPDLRRKITVYAGDGVISTIIKNDLHLFGIAFLDYQNTLDNSTRSLWRMEQFEHAEKQVLMGK